MVWRHQSQDFFHCRSFKSGRKHSAASLRALVLVLYSFTFRILASLGETSQIISLIPHIQTPQYVKNKGVSHTRGYQGQSKPNPEITEIRKQWPQISRSIFVNCENLRKKPQSQLSDVFTGM